MCMASPGSSVRINSHLYTKRHPMSANKLMKSMGEQREGYNRGYFDERSQQCGKNERTKFRHLPNLAVSGDSLI